MGRNNKPESEVKALAKKPDGDLVRPAHAVAMRWCVEGKNVEEILRENISSPQEFVAQLILRNAFVANPGTQTAIKAAKELLLLIDGNDDPGLPQIPITWIHKVSQGSDGEVKETKEIRRQVTFALAEEKE